MNTQVNQDSQDSQDFIDGSEVYFLLSLQKTILLEKNLPDGFYVKGIMRNKKFKPTSQVLGIGELATQGRYGWLELNSGEFFPMESDRKAEVPFVKGYLGPKGFMPSMREVIDAP